MQVFVPIAFFFSGVAALAFEIVWMRSLGLVLGASTLAVATTTAAYMGGLAVGSSLSGRFGDRLKSPLLWYGMLEITVAIFGLVIPSLCARFPTVALWSAVGRASSTPLSPSLDRRLLASPMM